jgi:hypothetical protein
MKTYEIILGRGSAELERLRYTSLKHLGDGQISLHTVRLFVFQVNLSSTDEKPRMVCLTKLGLDLHSRDHRAIRKF